MMKNNLFKVDESEANTRLDVYLTEIFREYSRTKIQNLIKTGKVSVNGKIAKPSLTLNIDDEILCSDFDSEDRILPENITVDVVYETDNYAVINKPSGMLSHPTSKEKTGTLVNALLYKYGDNLSDVNGCYRRGILHRLDKNTSGLLIIAKTNEAHNYFAEMIKNRQVEKHYRTIVKGNIYENLVIDSSIARSKSNPSKMCVSKDGKESLTEISIIEQFDGYSYLDVNLKTGRTHQIRVHLSSIGHPVFNDTLYGFGKMKIKTDEQVLQSYRLSFTDPFTSAGVELQIPPDDKICKVLDFLKKRSES